jgi:uncharacterized protein YggE
MIRSSICPKVGLSAILALISFLPAQAQQKSFVELTQNNRTIGTQGNFQSFVKPNRVTVIFAVKTFDKQIPAAYLANSEIAKNLLSVASKLNIKSSDVQTSDVSLYPDYLYNQKEPAERYKPVGYTASRSIAFVLDDVTKLATLLSSGLESGANEINGIEYQCTDAPRYRSEARIAALKAARKKAEEMAAALGCKVGKPISITEGYSSTSNLARVPVLQGATNGTIGPQGSDATFVSNSSQGFELGELSINSQVSVIFELE